MLEYYLDGKLLDSDLTKISDLILVPLSIYNELIGAENHVVMNQEKSK